MSRPLKTQADLHLSRKAFHAISNLAILSCMVFLPEWLCWAIYFSVGLPLVALDFSRRFSSRLNELLLKMGGPIVRQYEMTRLTGGSYAILAIGICFFVFPKPISFLAVLFLAIGDPVASFFGLLYGRTKILGKKSLYGSFAAFTFCTLSAFLFINGFQKYFQYEQWYQVFLVSCSCGLIGAISELAVLFGVDDNLSQPLVSGALLSLLFWQVGGVVYV